LRRVRGRARCRTERPTPAKARALCTADESVAFAVVIDVAIANAASIAPVVVPSSLNIERGDHGALQPRVAVQQPVDTHPQKCRELDELQRR
jgi:hypothetical protein